ncbi:MAG: cell wall-binding repeat-containing protein [Firmicutes bacterium]|nr:cell wall-binding repeat-containing protein [Bacillota bacterium]
MHSTKILSVLAASGLTLAACGFAGAPATHAARPTARPADTAPPAVAAGRIAGPDRAATAAAIAQRAFPQGVATVVVASGADANLFDPLVAGPLAAALHAPILLTDTATALNPATAQALEALGAQTAVLVGADANPALAAAVQAAGVGQVQQVGGADPYQTAAAVAQRLGQVTGQQTFSSVFITSGATANVVDALSGGAPAAMFPAPILLAPPAQNGQTALPPSEAPYAQGAETAYQLGAMAFAQVTNLPANTQVVDLGGPDRFATSQLIDETFYPRPPAVFVANGAQAHIVDALAATPYAALAGAPILLANGGQIPQATSQYLGLVPAHPPAVVFGGTASIPQGVTAQVQGAEGAGRGQAGARAPIGLSPNWRWQWVQTDQHYGLGTAAAFVADIARNRPWSLARELVDPADWAQVQAAYEHVVGQIQSFGQTAGVVWQVGGIGASAGSTTNNQNPFAVANGGGRWDVDIALQSIGKDGKPLTIPTNEWPSGPSNDNIQATSFTGPQPWMELGFIINYTREPKGGYAVSGLDINPATHQPGHYFPILSGDPGGLVQTLQIDGIAPNQTLQWGGQTFLVPQGIALRTNS